MKKIGKIILILILLLSCENEKKYMGYYRTYHLINMTNDTFNVVSNSKRSNVIVKRTMLPGGKLIFSEFDLSNFLRDSIIFYKYPDTTNVYIKFKYNEEPFNYKLDCFDKSNWRDSVVYYERVVHEDGFEIYNIIVEVFFKIEKENIIHP